MLVHESVQLALDEVFGTKWQISDLNGPSYDEKLPEGGEKALSQSEVDAWRLRHRTPIADEVEYIPECVKSFIVKIERQAGSKDNPKIILIEWK